MTVKFSAQNISKTFHLSAREIQAVSETSISIEDGEFVTIVGPSGCGKSTLFNILVGLQPPDDGAELYINGVQKPFDHLLGQVAFMPQRDMLLPWRNVCDNAILPCEIDGIPKREARDRVRSSIGQFGLTDFIDQYPNQLSGGMRQRVALMRTFMFDRDIMLLDEPFGALDALTRSLMQVWLLDVWNEYRRTVLFITHDIDEAIFLADRVLVMSARPGHIKHEAKVSLDRPRTSDMLTSGEFVDLKRELLSVVEAESKKAFYGTKLSAQAV